MTGGLVAVGLHPHKRGLGEGLLAGIAKGVAHGFGKPVAEAQKGGDGGGNHGCQGKGSSTLLPPAPDGNR